MRKTIIACFALLLVFLVISVTMVASPRQAERRQYRSTELKRAVTHAENTTRTEYLDSEGSLRMAADLGYAVRVVAKEEGRELETYLDDQGNRIGRAAGYWGILRAYDEKGNNIRVTYLDAAGQPVSVSYGYATEERTYNENGQIIACKYLDAEGNAAHTQYNAYGAVYAYDEKGRNYKTTYVDALGQPTILLDGYCYVVSEFYETDGPENGKAKINYYYLPDGTPARLRTGASAVYREYNEHGLCSLLTYLDADGKPMTTNAGFTTTVRTYHSDNSVATIMYYDINGQPFQLAEGQYGTKESNGRTVYLNADGTEQFNFRNFVYNNARAVVLIAVCAVILSALSGKRVNGLLLAACVAGIAYFTLLYRNSGKAGISFLESYKRILISADERADILKNIWLFIPLGAVMYRLCPRKRILLLPLLLSAAIEAIQYAAGIGYCELDDIISNGLGGAIGYGMGWLAQGVRKKECLKRGKA